MECLRGSSLGKVSRIEDKDACVVTCFSELEGEVVSLAYVNRRVGVDEFHVYRNVLDPFADIVQVTYALDDENELPDSLVGTMIYLESFVEMIDWGTQLDV